jgi:peptidyl-prolyl cis-trans isomerase C
MLIKPAILLAGAVSMLTLVACSSKDTVPAAGTGKDAVAATVNGTPINERLVTMMLKQRAGLGREAGAEARNAFINRLAMQLLISQEAVKKGLDKTPEVADQIELIKQSVLVDAFVQDYLKNNPVTDDAVKAEYDKMKAQSAGMEYKARHILVDKEADAKDIIAKLDKNPKAFEALAKERSKDPGSKANGGDLGWFDPRGMVPEFGAAVTKLAKGKFTEQPVKTQFGYHVILLEDSRQKPVPPLEQVKATLTQQLQEQNLQKMFDDMKAKAKIEIAQTTPAAPADAAKPAEGAKPAADAKK